MEIYHRNKVKFFFLYILAHHWGKCRPACTIASICLFSLIFLFKYYSLFGYQFNKVENRREREREREKINLEKKKGMGRKEEELEGVGAGEREREMADWFLIVFIDGVVR